MPAPALAAVPVVAPVAAGGAVAGGTVIAFPVAAGATAGSGVVAAEVLVPALLAAGGALVTATGATLVAGGATLSGLNAWRAFSSRRIPELQEQGMSYRDAQKQAGEEFKKQKNKGGSPVADGTKVKGVRGLSSLRAEVPYQVTAEPDLAAAWDIAEGVLDFLMSNANPGDGQTFRREAAAAWARAKGETPEHDQTEHNLGQAIGKALLLVAAHRGVTADDWSRMTPPQLGQLSSGLSRAAEAVTGIDVNNDGEVGGVADILGGVVEEVVGGVLPFLEG